MRMWFRRRLHRAVGDRVVFCFDLSIFSLNIAMVDLILPMASNMLHKHTSP